MDWRSWSIRDGSLTLRPWQPGDRERLGITPADEEVRRFFGRPLERLDRVSDPDAPAFAICEERQVVGCIWCRPGARPYEIGYYLHPNVWGRGLATRSLRLVTERMLASGVSRVELFTHPDNVRSQHVAEHAGYRRVGEKDPYALFKDGTTVALAFARDDKCE